MLPYFLWHGVDSRTMGIFVNDYPDIIKPKERVTTETIPGRSGTVTMLDSDLPLYETLTKTITCTVEPTTDMETVTSWLRGSGKVVFGNEPNRSYDARIIDQISYALLVRGKKHRTFSVNFLCQPYKSLYPLADDITITASGTKVNNIGNVEAYPIFKVYASSDFSITTAGGAVDVTLPSGQSGIMLNWDTQDCTTLDGGTLLNQYVSGEPQYLPAGESTIYWTGDISQIVITPNWRFI